MGIGCVNHPSPVSVGSQPFEPYTVDAASRGDAADALSAGRGHSRDGSRTRTGAKVPGGGSPGQGGQMP